MILESKPVADQILNNVKEEITELNKRNIYPKLAILRIGDNIGSVSYEKSIKNLLQPLGIEIESITFNENVTQKDFLEEINSLNNNKLIDAILILKPLPKSFDEKLIDESISFEKDVDASNPINLGKLMVNNPNFIPCTPQGVMELLDYYQIPIKGQNITIINNSNLFGKPLSILLTNEFATINLCHEFTNNLEDFTKEADIIVTAAGVSNLITPEMINDDSIIIDVAVTQLKDKNGNFILNDNQKKIRCGDVSTECKDKAKMITSVTPGCGDGTGKITTALLAKNIVKAAQKGN